MAQLTKNKFKVFVDLAILLSAEDGNISNLEIKEIKLLSPNSMSEDEINEVIETSLQKLSRNELTFSSLMKEINSNSRYEQKRLILNYLHIVATADGTIDSREVDLIDKIAEKLAITVTDLTKIKQHSKENIKLTVVDLTQDFDDLNIPFSSPVEDQVRYAKHQLSIWTNRLNVIEDVNQRSQIQNKIDKFASFLKNIEDQGNEIIQGDISFSTDEKEDRLENELIVDRFKLCKTCGYSRPIEQFSKDNRTEDKLRSVCKECSGDFLCHVCNQFKPKSKFSFDLDLNNNRKDFCNTKKCIEEGERLKAELERNKAEEERKAQEKRAEEKRRLEYLKQLDRELKIAERKERERAIEQKRKRAIEQRREKERREEEQRREERERKECQVCKSKKLLKFYNQDARFADGYKNICNSCIASSQTGQLSPDILSKSKQLSSDLERKAEQAKLKLQAEKIANAKKLEEIQKKKERIDQERKVEENNQEEEKVGLVYEILAIGILIGAIYLSVKLIGAGIDYIQSFNENNSIENKVNTSQIDSDNKELVNLNDNSQIIFEYCEDLEKQDISYLKKVLIRREKNLVAEFKIFKACIDGQIVFQVLNIHDDNDRNYYNTEKFDVCCKLYTLNPEDNLVYGSLALFDPPNLQNVLKPFDLIFYGGESLLDQSSFINKENLQFTILSTDIPKTISFTSENVTKPDTPAPPQPIITTTTVYRMHKAAFISCKNVSNFPEDKVWDYDISITAGSSAVNLINQKIYINRELYTSETLVVDIEKFTRKDLNLQKEFDLVQDVNLIEVYLTIKTVDRNSVDIFCKTSITDLGSSPSTTSITESTTTTTTSTTIPITESYLESENFELWSGSASYPNNFKSNSIITFYEICSDREAFCKDYEISTSHETSNGLSGNALYLNRYRTIQRKYGFQLPTNKDINILKMRIASTWWDLFNARIEVFYFDSTSIILDIDDIDYSYDSDAKNYTDFSFKSSKNIEKFEVQSNKSLYIDNLIWGFNNDLEPPEWPNYPYTEIRVANITRYYFEVLWPVALDNNNVAGYYFNLNGKKVAEYTRINDNNSIFLDGLTRNTTYELEVIAYDDAGNLSVRNPIIIVTTSP